jgi:DNA ligase D-like protein (predicted 3'-phosphoesterase)
MSASDNRPRRRTRRPRGRRTGKSGPCFVVQHHAARENFYDFRLEIDGVLVSWAIPRGPVVNQHERRMARRTEDQPLDGAGEATTDDDTDAIVVWDQGTYANKTSYEMTTCLGRGHLSILLNGAKLRGGYALTRIREGDDETWLLIKRLDDEADSENRPNGWR